MLVLWEESTRRWWIGEPQGRDSELDNVVASFMLSASEKSCMLAGRVGTV